MASAAETENLKEENRANRAIILGLGASVETMKADYENKISKAQQQLKRLESKHKNVVASLEAENTDHRRTAQELRSKSNENESWREKVSTLNSTLDVVDDLKNKFAAEQMKVADLRRQVSVLLIGLSPHCQYEAYFFCFYSTASEGEKSRTLRKNWTVCDSRLARWKCLSILLKSALVVAVMTTATVKRRPPTNLPSTVLDYLFELARGKMHLLHRNMKL